MKDKEYIAKASSSIDRSIAKLKEMRATGNADVDEILDQLRSASSALTRLRLSANVIQQNEQEKHIVNLTSHDVNVINQEGVMVKIPPSGEVARCSYMEKVIDVVDDIRISQMEYTDITGLPDPRWNTYYLVSKMVASAATPTRNDLLVPGARMVDVYNKLIGSKGLILIGKHKQYR